MYYVPDPNQHIKPDLLHRRFSLDLYEHKFLALACYGFAGFQPSALPRPHSGRNL